MNQDERTTSRGWVVATVVLALLLGSAWLETGGQRANNAAAQIPDAGHQRSQVIAELKRLNQQVAELNQLLRTGKAMVTLRTPKPPPVKPAPR